MIKVTHIHKDDVYCQQNLTGHVKAKTFVRFEESRTANPPSGYKSGLLVAADPKDNCFMYGVKFKVIKNG